MSQNDSTFKINKRSLLTAALIIFILIIGSYCLTLFVPPGHYDVAPGTSTVVPGSYVRTGDAGQYPVYNIILAIFKSFAPGGSVNMTMIVIMLFILFIGGSFTLLDKSGILRAVIAKIAAKMYRRKYLLIAVISFVFMCLGSFFGILEEIVPLIPLVVGLSYMLGWDSLMGLSLSLLSTCFGFSAALYNPFLIGVAQKIAGVPLYSGTLLRLAFFAVTYAVLLLFLLRYAKKLDANPLASSVYNEDAARKEKYQLTPAQIREAAQFNRKPIVFIGILFAVMFAFLIAASSLGLSDYSLIFICVIFILASAVGSKLAGYKSAARTFFKGIGDIAPGILLIPMAMAVSTIIKDSGIQDTLLNYCSAAVTNTSPYVNVLIIYAAVIILEFFVAQASAKAFLVLPIIVPLAAMSGISGQTVVFTYAIGDGFLNVLYPTNAMLLIALGLTTVSYTKWLKFSIRIQILIQAIGIGFLMFALAIGYA
jgi:uncharacterized ion transporter superfamily protein YfcC